MSEEKLIDILQQLKLKRIAGEDLFAGGKELVIIHDFQEYHLRITSNNKLILTK